MLGNVLIVGQMRSGTAAVAEVVHRLGIPVALSMLAPVPPTYRPDWEDTDLVTALLPLAADHQMRDARGFLREHFRGRRVGAERFFGSPRFAVKSPLLALCWDDVLATIGPDPIVIVVERDQAAIDASIRRTFPANALGCLQTNERIRAAIEKIEPTLRVRYEGLVQNPVGGCAEIGRCFGITDVDRVFDSIASVQEPTSCPR